MIQFGVQSEQKSFTFLYTFGAAPAEARYKISGVRKLRVAFFIGLQQGSSLEQTKIYNESVIARIFLLKHHKNERMINTLYSLNP